MDKDPALGKTRFSLDGDWSLFDFSGFGREFEQVYALIHALQQPQSAANVADERVRRAFEAFPWRGGWSAVNFYESLRHSMPKRHRPRIVAIRYASPGYIELLVVLGVARAVSALVRHLSQTARHVASTYHEIHRGMEERRLLRLDVRREELRLEGDEEKFAAEAAARMAHAMGFSYLAQLNEVTPNDLATLKVMMSLYRRLRGLAKRHSDGRMTF